MTLEDMYTPDPIVAMGFDTPSHPAANASERKFAFVWLELIVNLNMLAPPCP
jgi:hypothetical protein